MFGRTVLTNNAVMPTRVSADGSPEYKAGGITIAWTLVTAASGNVTLADGSVILDGQKYLRYGQVMVQVTATGFYAPYDSALTNGQELLSRGKCFIMDETVLQYPSGSTMLSAAQDIVGGAIEGGLVWLNRILQAGTGSASLTAGPTFANLNTAFPRLRYCDRDNVTAG